MVIVINEIEKIDPLWYYECETEYLRGFNKLSDALKTNPDLWDCFDIGGMPPPFHLAQAELGTGTAVMLSFDEGSMTPGRDNSLKNKFNKKFDLYDLWSSTDGHYMLFGADTLINEVEQVYPDNILWTYQRGVVNC